MSEAQDKQAKRAAALRANLRRRKAQAREKQGGEAKAPTPDTERDRG